MTTIEVFWLGYAFGLTTSAVGGPLIVDWYNKRRRKDVTIHQPYVYTITAVDADTIVGHLKRHPLITVPVGEPIKFELPEGATSVTVYDKIPSGEDYEAP